MAYSSHNTHAHAHARTCKCIVGPGFIQCLSHIVTLEWKDNNTHGFRTINWIEARLESIKCDTFPSLMLEWRRVRCSGPDTPAPHSRSYSLTAHPQRIMRCNKTLGVDSKLVRTKLPLATLFPFCENFPNPPDCKRKNLLMSQLVR